MSRRRVITTAVATVVLMGGVATAALVLAGGASSDEGDGDEGTVTTATAEVVRRDLVEQEQLDGTLGYGDSSELSFGTQGTVTALAAEGSVVERGGVLGEVDGRPIVLFNGDRPLWRPLGESVDDGADVRVLEENLIALGYATESQLGPNETWTAATTAAVERWQDAMGVEETGTVDPGDVVVVPTGSVRVADHLATVGGGAGGPALSVSGTERIVTVDLDADYQSLLAVDQPVEVELPDGTRTPGRVRSIATVVEPGDPQTGSGATVDVVVVLDDPAASGSLDQAPVDVHVTTSAAEGVLAVPVDALLALAEGGYAVEKVTGSGLSELVGVETGAFADGYVEVTPTTGELAEGDEVVVPA